MRQPLRLAAVATALVVAALASGCGGDDADSGAETTEAATSEATLSVLSSFFPIHEIVTRVGGERVEADNLTPAGVEPHDFELTSDDIEAVADADAVFYLGQGFMPALERALRRAEGEKLDLLEGLPLIKGGHAQHNHADTAAEAPAGKDEAEGELDPHIWLDPKLMIRIAQQIEETLSTLDPEGAEGYAERGGVYRDELQALDREFADTLVDCQRNVFVTSHAAFGYLARAYRLEEQSVTGVAPETEPDPERIAELADLVDELNVPVIFAETLLPKKLAQALAREAGVKTDVLNPLEGLTEDQEADGADYLSVMRDNLAALDAALDCVGAG